MNDDDVKKILKDVDEALVSYKTESVRLTRAYQHRKNTLEEIRNRPTLNPLFRKRAADTLLAVENAWSVHLAFTSMLMAVLQFSRTAVDSYFYETIPSNAPMGDKCVDFLKRYTLMGYVHTVHVLVTISVSLLQIYQKGKRSELKPKVKKLPPTLITPGTLISPVVKAESIRTVYRN